jgi:hypothetical protein
MSVNIIWSATSGGASITEKDLSNIENGSESTEQEIYIRHTGVNPITSVGLYINAFSETYEGDATAADDLSEILAWGNNSTVNSFGGVLVSFNGSTWPTYNSKSPTDAFVHRTGVGDSASNAVTLSAAATGADAGIIAASANAHFHMKVKIPSNEDVTGVRQFEHVLTYAYTS